MEVDIHYFYFANPTQQKQVEFAIDCSKALFPWWVREICVEDCSPNGSDTVLQIHQLPNYRRATIIVRPLFYEYPADKQVGYMRHEICHTMLSTLAVWVKERLIAPLEEENQRLHDYALAEFQAKVEQVVEDLAIGRVGNDNKNCS